MEEEYDNDDYAAPIGLQPPTGIQGNRELKAEGLPQQSARVRTIVFLLPIVNTAQDFSYNPTFERGRANSSRGRHNSL
jgi:hypothetical protein